MKSKIINRPAKLEDINFEDLYLEINVDWEKRAKQLQARRWQKIKQKEEQGSPL